MRITESAILKCRGLSAKIKFNAICLQLCNKSYYILIIKSILQYFLMTVMPKNKHPHEIQHKTDRCPTLKSVLIVVISTKII